MQISHKAGCSGFVTISIGLASAKDGRSVKSLISQADIALYAAKARGRDRTVSFAAGMQMENADDYPLNSSDRTGS